jgi:hypothetical protein
MSVCLPYFLDFCNTILCIIENDSELKEEHEKILKEKEISRENYEKKIQEEYLNSISIRQHRQLPPREDNSNEAFPTQEEKCITASNAIGSKADDNVRMLDNRVVEVGLERIRIHHSNPNYKKEMDEFEKWLREDREGEEPRKKITCTFSPSLLPINIREKLYREGELSP